MRTAPYGRACPDTMPATSEAVDTGPDTGTGVDEQTNARVTGFGSGPGFVTGVAGFSGFAGAWLRRRGLIGLGLSGQLATRVHKHIAPPGRGDHQARDPHAEQACGR